MSLMVPTQEFKRNYTKALQRFLLTRVLMIFEWVVQEGGAHWITSHWIMDSSMGTHTGPTSHYVGEGPTLDQHHTMLEKVPHWTNITLCWRRSHTGPTSHWAWRRDHTGPTSHYVGEGTTLDQHHTGLEKVSH